MAPSFFLFFFISMAPLAVAGVSPATASYF
jgi:hypothetical protein